MARHIAYIENIGTAEGNSPFGRRGYGWENNIKFDPKETGNRMGLSDRSVLESVMKLWVP